MKKKTYKKKEAKVKGKSLVLPHYYRIITAVPKTYSVIILFFMGFLTLILLMSVIFLGINFFEVKKERAETIQRLTKAQSIIKNHPNQASAYYTAALFAIRLKDYETAREYLKQALFLNPEMHDAKKILPQIEERG